MSIASMRQPGDEQLLVTFRKDKIFSEAEKRHLEFDFIRIAIPGDKHTVIDTIVTPEYAQRFEAEYGAFKRQQETGIPEGMALEDWGHLNQYQIAEMKVLNILTVQQLAGLSDGQVQRIGMGGLQLRDAARKEVGSVNNDDKIAALEEQIAQLTALAQAQADAPRRGPGRPPKEAEKEAE